MRLFLFLSLLQACLAWADIKVYVSPCGSDTNTGLDPDKPLRTLPKAQDAVRALDTDHLSQNVTVHVAPGKYVLSEPLIFEAVDSGTNEFSVSWVGPGAVISGGYKIENWTQGSGGIYAASVPRGLKSRNLYVDGKAANYARRQINRKDFNYTATGMEWSDPDYDWLMSTAGIQDAEVRFIASFTDRYAPIQAVGHRQLVMKQNSWSNQIVGWDIVQSPFAEFGVFVQNCRALLDTAGEYFLDSIEGKVYYIPLDGEDMSRVDSYLGILEAIIVVGGTYEEPAHDISFEGFEFAHSTWLRPKDYGYPDQQTGGYIGENATYPEFEASRPHWWQMPSAVQISAAKNIVFQKCTFNELGAGGVGIGNDANAHLSEVGLGASHISIVDGYFTQIMGGSITAGGIQADAHHPNDPRMVNSHVTISGNIFYNNSALFSSTVNILVTYVQNSIVSHNDIHHAPYSGISHGYGWGSNDAGGSPDYLSRGLYKYQPLYQTPTTSANNLIEGNLIHTYGISHTDLGALYSLSCSPGTLFINNYGYDSAFKGLHPDEGSSNMTYINNIMLNDGLWYDPNDSSDDYRTGNNTFVDNWGRNKNPKYPLDGYPNHTGPHGNTFLRNKIAQYVNETNEVAQKAAYRAGVLPGARSGRPISNGLDLMDAFLSISRTEDSHAAIKLSNFDDVNYTEVTFTALANGRSLEPLAVPTIVPADNYAIATFEFSGINGTNVTAQATYTNPRIGWKRTIKTNQAI